MGTRSRRLMKKCRRVVFLDRDGTLIHDKPGFYLTRPENLRVYRGAAGALRLLREAGYSLVIVSNQSGLGRGYLDRPALGRIHARLKRELARAGARLDAIYFCPHHPADGCRCRKPLPAMGRRARREMGLTFKGAVMVGDKKADIDFAKNLGIASVHLATGHGRSQRLRYGKRLRPTHRAKTLLGAARWIIRNSALAAVLFVTAGASASARVPISSAALSSPDILVGSTVAVPSGAPRLSFFPEHLDFEVKWGVLSMGFATMEISDVVSFNGEPAYRLVSRARTARFADKFYKVRDVNESWLRASDLVSLGYSKKLREGDFFRDEWVLYDYAKERWLSKRVDKDGGFEYSSGELQGLVQDILSSIYMIRSKKLEVGDEVIMDVNTKKTWPLVVKVMRKQTIRTPAGTFRTILVEPMLRDEGIFIQKGKRLRVWLSDDERRLPVLMKVEIIFGHISCYLTGINKDR